MTSQEIISAYKAIFPVTKEDNSAQLADQTPTDQLAFGIWVKYAQHTGKNIGNMLNGIQYVKDNLSTVVGTLKPKKARKINTKSTPKKTQKTIQDDDDEKMPILKVKKIVKNDKNDKITAEDIKAAKASINHQAIMTVREGIDGEIGQIAEGINDGRIDRIFGDKVIGILETFLNKGHISNEDKNTLYKFTSTRNGMDRAICAAIYGNKNLTQYLYNKNYHTKATNYGVEINGNDTRGIENFEYDSLITYHEGSPIMEQHNSNNEEIDSNGYFQKFFNINPGTLLNFTLRYERVTSGLMGNDIAYCCDFRKNKSDIALFIATCPPVVLYSLVPTSCDIIKKHLTALKSIKVRVMIEYTYYDGIYEKKDFIDREYVLISRGSQVAIDKVIKEAIEKENKYILDKLGSHTIGNGVSGMRFCRLLRYTLNIFKNVSVRGGRYLPYTGILEHKTKSLINMEPLKAQDPAQTGCFMYCMWAAFSSDKIKNSDNRKRAIYYYNSGLVPNLNYTDIPFPVPLDPEIFKRFEKNNESLKIVLQVYRFDYETNHVYNVYRNDNFGKEGFKSIPLIYMPTEGHPLVDPKYVVGPADGHYLYIKDLDKFFTGISTDSHQKTYTCRKCGTSYYKRIEGLRKHEEVCTGTANTIEFKMPEPGTKKEFKNFKNQQECPIYMVYDFESYQPSVTDDNGVSIKKLSKHIISSASLTVIRIDQENPDIYVFYGKNCGQELLGKILEVSKNFLNTLHDKRLHKPLNMSIEDEINFNNATDCSICHRSFTSENTLCKQCTDKFDRFVKSENERLKSVTLFRCPICINKNYACKECLKQVKPDLSKFVSCSACSKIKIDDIKVRDHCHFSGKFRGAAHKSCNLNFKLNYRFKVPVFAHNAEGYDHHLILNEMLKNEQLKENINVIARTGERYMSMSTQYFSLMDSYKHLVSSLHTKVYNLLWVDPITCEHCKKVIDDPLDIKYENDQFIGTFECQDCKNKPNIITPIIEKRIPARHVYSAFPTTTYSVTENGIINNEKLALVCMKGEYPYTYMTSEATFLETQLPPIEAFKNDLSKGYLDDEDRGVLPQHCYDRAQKAFKTFECKNLRDYELVYVKSDTTLLADVLKNYFDKNMKIDGLHPAYYLTTPAYSDDRHKLMNYMNKIKGVAFFEKDKYNNWDENIYTSKFPLPKDANINEIINDPEPTLEHNEELFKVYENGIRGGLCNAMKFYSKANNTAMPDYDPALPTKSIMYNDMTAMYPGVMKNKMLPCSNGHLIEDAETIEQMSNPKYLAEWPEDCPIGALYVVDAETLPEYHDMFNDLPLICEKRDIKYEELSESQKKITKTFEKAMNADLPDTKAADRVKAKMKDNVKLISTLGKVTEYPVHYCLLKFWLEMKCIKLIKVHKIITYRQAPWIKNYIERFTEIRQNATNESEKDLAKLFTTSLFGKQMENKKGRCNVNLIDTDIEENIDKILKKMNDPYYRGHKYIQTPISTHVDSDNCEHFIQKGTIAIMMNKKRAYLDTMMQTGQAILDLSKLEIYKYWYKYVKVKYPTAKLMYQDTDSLIYEAPTDNFFADMKRDNGKIDGWKFDMSDCKGEYKDTTYKKVPLTMKSETGSDPIYEFIALGPKSYSVVTLEDRTNWKAKVKGDPMKHHHEEYRLSLFTSMYQNSTFRALRSYNHQMFTVMVEKRGLCPMTDKRHYIRDSYETLAHGHIRIATGYYPIVEEYETIEQLQARAIDAKAHKEKLDSESHYYTINEDKIVKTNEKPDSKPLKVIIADIAKPKNNEKIDEDAPLNLVRVPIPEYTKTHIDIATTLKGDYGLLEKVRNADDITIIRNEKDDSNAFFASYKTSTLEKAPFFSSHEVILGDKPQKIAFDIDYEVPYKYRHIETELITELTKAINETFKEKYNHDADIQLMTSSGPINKTTYKISYHILASIKYYVSNSIQSRKFAELVKDKLPLRYQDVIDFGIYSAVHNLRVLGSFKHLKTDPEYGKLPTNCKGMQEYFNIHGKLPKEMIDHMENVRIYGSYAPVNMDRIKRGDISFKDSLITNVAGLTLLPDIAKAKPKMENIHISDVKMELALQLFPSDPAHIPGRTNGRYINFTRMKPSYCDICQRAHDKDNTLYLVLMDDNTVCKGCIKMKSKLINIGKIDPTKIVEKPKNNDYINTYDDDEIYVDSSGDLIEDKPNVHYDDDDEDDDYADKKLTKEYIKKLYAAGVEDDEPKDDRKIIELYEELDEKVGIYYIPDSDFHCITSRYEMANDRVNGKVKIYQLIDLH